LLALALAAKQRSGVGIIKISSSAAAAKHASMAAQHQAASWHQRLLLAHTAINGSETTRGG